MRLTLVVTSPRVAPGLLSWPAWQAIASAGRLLASDPASPTAAAVAAQGHPVEAAPDSSVNTLLAAAAADDVTWLADDEEAERLPGELARAVVAAAAAGADAGPAEIEVLHGSYDVPGARLLDLVAVMDRLRTSCPWDREQTHRSLARYLLEETYETLEAIEAPERAHLQEELGDLLLQVVFHARIAAEHDQDAFTVDDVAGGIVDKLVHRHPHVFAGLEVADAEEVNANWEVLKAQEKGRASVLDGVPLALPALVLADKVIGRAARTGVAPAAGTSLGDELLALVDRARAEGLDAEQELREAVRRLADEVRAAERD